MPYIKKERREELDKGDIPVNAGELNYLITQQLTKYIFINGESYKIYNDVMGALEGAKLELYRRKIVPYENRKMAENGDVY